MNASRKIAKFWFVVLVEAHCAEITTKYIKPTVSSKDCMKTVALIAAKTEKLGNDGACMQCDPANKVRQGQHNLPSWFSLHSRNMR